MFKQKRNMKKTYIAPLTEDLRVEECEMICTSLSDGGKASDNSITEADSRELLFFEVFE